MEVSLSCRPIRKTLGRVPFLFVALLCISATSSTAWTGADSKILIEKMENAYAAVKDYQTQLLIIGFGQERSFQKTHELLYTFKKPNRIRIDFQRPHRGMTITYPDKDGKVVVRVREWAPFLTLHLDQTSSFLEISPGQYIHQTDLGVLIRNIAHSLTDMLMGDLDVAQDQGQVVIRVLSDNPFRRGQPTRYEFFIDCKKWLPVAVRESSAEGVLRRTVDYNDLKLNTGMPDSFFRLD